MTEGHDPDPAAIHAQHKQVKESLARVVNEAVAAPEPTGIDALVRHYWALLAGLLAFAVAWGISTAQIHSVGSAVAKVGTKVDTMSEQIAGMKAAAGYNDRELSDLRARVWKLEARR